jgi:general secretion pathway protein G
MRPGRDRPSGFTLIELMLVVAIIGLLATIAIPRFAGLIIKSKEAAVKGQLGGLQSAISIYYSDNEGIFPSSPLDGLTVGSKYIDAIATISIPTVPAHAPSNRVGNSLSDWFGAPGSGAWKYNFGTGALTVHCNHPDSTGRVWSTW